MKGWESDFSCVALYINSESSRPEVLYFNNIRGGISQIGEWMPATLLT